MTDLSRQNVSGAAAGAEKALALGFEPLLFVIPTTASATKDAGRVKLGGGFAGVPENYKGKVRV